MTTRPLPPEPDDPSPRRWAVGPDASGERLDRWLATKAHASRAEVRRWLDAGGVWLDGRVVPAGKGGVSLRPGQRVELRALPRGWIAGSAGELRVLTQGDGWVAVDKPAGVAIHPLRHHEPGTLLGQVAAAFPGVVGVGDEGELRSGVVHRLDRDTTGVVLFALTDARWRALRSAFAEHRVSKTYRALCAGGVERDGQREAWLNVRQHHPARVVEVARNTDGAYRCSLAWRVLRQAEHATEVEVDLHTGFLHQVRVMFAAIGHPLLGDGAYAPPGIAALAQRQMLHAASIAVDDIQAVSPLPQDYSDISSRLA